MTSFQVRNVVCVHIPYFDGTSRIYLFIKISQRSMKDEKYIVCAPSNILRVPYEKSFKQCISLTNHIYAG